MKLNIGSNNIKIEGYLNLDGLDLENVDATCSLNIAPYELKIREENLSKFGDKVIKLPRPNGEDVYRILDNVVDSIKSVEFLEHISFRETDSVLSEWYRILGPDGALNVQVPDCGKAMEYYVNGEICSCVPHKGTSEQQVPDPLCFICGGKGKIHPNRWLFSFTGAQKHKYDAHLNIFTKDRMETALTSVGFKDIKFTDDKYKLKMVCIK